jgi:hypothetical protein
MAAQHHMQRLLSDDIIDFCEGLTVPEGAHVGQPIRLRE